MSRPQSRWWRAYDAALENPKVQRLSDKLFRTWFNVLCIACRNGGVIPPNADAAFLLRLSDAETRARLNALCDAGLLDVFDNVMKPHDWDEMQFQSDVSSPRVKRFRERHRNVSETPDETAPYTETETDTDRTSLRSVEPAAKKPIAKRATRLPADWTPSETDRQFAKSRGFSESSIDLETQKIRNWSASAPKGACLDWPRRWENWILQAQPRAGPNRGRGPSVAEIARMDQDFFDEPRPSSHIATESARGSEQVCSGFAGPLSERDRGRAVGGVLDLRPADAERR